MAVRLSIFSDCRQSVAGFNQRITLSGRRLSPLTPPFFEITMLSQAANRFSTADSIPITFSLL